MTIENKNKPVEVRMRAFIRTLLCAIFITLLYIPGLIKNNILEIEKRNWAWMTISLFLILSLYSYLKNYYYVNIMVGKTKTIIKYYSLRPLSSKRNTIQIPSTDLLAIDIKKGFLGFGKNMILYQRVKNKVAVYPPISLSGFKKKELNKIMDFFKPILKNKSTK